MRIAAALAVSSLVLAGLLVSTSHTPAQPATSSRAPDRAQDGGADCEGRQPAGSPAHIPDKGCPALDCGVAFRFSEKDMRQR
jgi:hypothetical protein